MSSSKVLNFVVSGTRVIKVVATDEDPDTSPNGRVTYSIVSTHDKFTIDPQTGWLSTNAVSLRNIFWALVTQPSESHKAKIKGKSRSMLLVGKNLEFSHIFGVGED